MYEKLFFKSGKCSKCGAVETVVMGTERRRGVGICSRCDSELFYNTAEFQKNRYLNGGPVNPRFNNNPRNKNNVARRQNG